MLETFYAPKLAEFSLSHRPPKRKSMELDTGVLIGHTKRADKLEIVSEDLLLVWCKTHFQDAVKSTIIVKDPTIFGEIIELLQDVAENELGDCSELTSYPPGNGSDLVFSYELAVSIIKARWLATGVVPPGCEVKEECEEFFVRRAKSKNGGENEEA